MNDELTDVSWRRLIHSIENGNCILFLGPDTSCLTENDKSLTASLADILNEQANQELHLAAQSYLTQGNDEFDLLDTAQHFYAKHKQSTSDFHRALAHLPFEVIIQTTPDNLMFNALKEKSAKQPLEAYFHLRNGLNIAGTGSIEFNFEPSRNNPVVFGLHGDMEDASSMVLTENDVLEFFVSLMREKAAIPPVILRKIRLATNCLFVGFGFHHWYQRLILHVLRGEGGNNKWRSLALENQQFFSDEQTKQNATFYDSEHKIDFSSLSYWQFAMQLSERYQSQQAETIRPTSPTKPQLRAIPTNPVETDEPLKRPKVFISYDSSFYQQVEQLSINLSQLGVDTWLDKDHLRGGDDWERQIKHVLSEIVDYFVVLNSEGLSTKESWVHYEVNIALDRAKKMPPGFVFILPCHFLGNRAEADNLKHIQFTDIPSPEECHELADVILQDWRANRHLGNKMGGTA